MADTQPNQAMGNGKAPRQTDGVEETHGKSGGSESQGGAYPNPHTGKDGGDQSGFMGHGGQTGMEYSGTGATGDPDAENENAVAK
ncbi:MAG TPA: hypothetical protein VF695_06845 [Sphingomonas sp.]